MKTKEKLAQSLEEAGAPDDMIQKARAGHYDDYETDIANPILQLIRDAQINNLINIASRAKMGEFDGTEEEANEWYKNYMKGVEA